MSRLLTLLRDAVLIALICFGLLEIALRLVPGAVPLELLVKMNGTLRQTIAARLDLPVARDMQVLTRDDGGPTLTLPQPSHTYRNQFTDAGSVAAVTMDGLGFCNPPGREQGPVAIIGLGDSFTWCTTVHPQETWPVVLGQQTGLPSYNLGRSGVGLYEYIQILKQFGSARQPKLVVVNIYEGNDLRDALRYRSYRDQGGAQQTLRNMQRDMLSPVGRLADSLHNGWLARHSYAFGVSMTATFAGWEWLRANVLVRDKTERKAGMVNFRYSLQIDGKAVRFNEQNSDTDEVVMARSVVKGEVSPDVLGEGLATLKQLVAQHGAKLLLLYTPSASTTYAPVVRFEDAEVATLMPAYSQAFRRYLAEQSAALGFDFLDLTPHLQQAAARPGAPLLNFPTNIHYSQAGHRLVAETVAAWIAQRREALGL